MPDEYQVFVYTGTRNKRGQTPGNLREFVCVAKDVNTEKKYDRERWSITTISRESFVYSARNHSMEK
jgi:hypothetical protein